MSLTQTPKRESPAPVTDGGTEDRVLLRSVDRALYEAINGAREESSVPRLAWIDKELELMSPSPWHDQFADLLSDLVKILLRVLGVPHRSFRTVTMKRPGMARAKEADACFYIAHVRNAPSRRAMELDLGAHPPPDLAIEVELSRPKVDVERLYAGIGVPELWRCDRRRVRFLRLGADGRYVEQERSLGLPQLRADEVLPWIERADGMDDLQWSAAVERWAREELAGRAG